MKLIVVCFMFGFYCFCWKFSLHCSLTLLTGRPGLDPWVGKISWRRKWQPTPVILPGKFHERRTLVGYSPLDCKELHTTEQLYFLHYNSLVLSELSFKTLTAYLPNISDWTNGCCRWKHTFDLMVSLISMWKTDWAELLIQASNSTILFCLLERRPDSWAWVTWCQWSLPRLHYWWWISAINFPNNRQHIWVFVSEYQINW